MMIHKIFGNNFLKGPLLILGVSCAFALTGKDLILKSANSNVNAMNGDELISVLQGNVVFFYDDAVITSEYAKWWKSKGTVLFTDRVHMTKKEQTLTCSRLNYEKSKKWLAAEGNVDFSDTKEHTRITGQHGDYYPDTKFIAMKGKPVLYFYDTTAHDTLVIHGEKMTYDDSLKMATVQEKVTIKKGKLLSNGNLARYYSELNKAQLRQSPHIYYERDSLSGDSVDMKFTKKALQGMSVSGNSQGMYKELSKKDTMLSRVFGDSLYMALDDSGKVDSMWVYRNAKSAYFPLNSPALANEAFGKIMLVAFTKKGDVDNVKVWGNAKSIYHVDEGDKGGLNNASGDSIQVAFKDGKASHVKLCGSVRGYYAPGKK
jgi:lipopolysaccharide export system protein LptA